jgi:uncharacterized protein (TIGR02147 family)
MMPRMTTVQSNFRNNSRDFLRDLVSERIRRNPAYSLKAFAQKVGVSQGFLSEVLAGKKNLSVESAAKIASRLELPPTHAEYFSLLIQLEAARDPSYREAIVQRINTLHPQWKVYDLSLDAFRVISEWYHFPIIDLTEMDGFAFSAQAVADRLGVSPLEIEAAIQRLLRLELLIVTPTGAIRKTKDHFLAESAVPTEAILQFHRKILEKLMLALPSQGKSQRLSRTDIVLIDPDLQDEVEKIIDDTANRIVALASQSQRKSRVSALTVHFFNLVPERTKS